MARFKVWRPFKEWSPISKAVAWMIPATLTVLMHNLFMPVPPDTRKVLEYWYQNELQSWTNIVDFVLWTPFKEEAVYRWPSLLLLFSLLRQIIKWEPTQKRDWLVGAYALSITTMAAMTASWASLHDYPITVFCYGVVWGGLMFKTKSPFYSWLFHAGCNAISIPLIALGYHFWPK